MSIAAIRPGLPLATINPVAKIAATVPLSIVLVLTLDAVSAAVAIACELVLFSAVGLGRLLWSRRTLPVWSAVEHHADARERCGDPDGQGASRPQ